MVGLGFFRVFCWGFIFKVLEVGYMLGIGVCGSFESGRAVGEVAVIV